MASRTRWLTAFVIVSAITAIIWAVVHRPPTAADLFPSGEIRVGVDPSYAPFASYVGADIRGLDIDLAHAIGDDLGISVRIVALGFDGLYDALYTGQVDVIISALPIDNTRLDRVAYTYPYFNAGLVLVSPQDRPIDSMRDLGGLRLAYEYGSTAHAEANIWRRRITAFETFPYELDSHALDAVRIGDTDAALVDAISAGLYHRQYPGWNIQRTQVTDLLFAAALRTDQPDRVRILNESIQRLFAHETIQEIVDRWL